jgi:WhiB family transcriptional regulator, redox-sensing transcriptional regulator
MNVYDLFADLAAEAARPELAWLDFALCAEVAGDLWFPPKGSGSREAKAVCMQCPVRAQCLQYALDNEIVHGIFGGLSDRQRRAIRVAGKERAA